MNFSRQNQNEEFLNEFQKNLMAINSQVREEKLVKYRLEYQDYDEKLNSSIIGKIFYNNFRRVEKYESQLKGNNMDHDEIKNKINSSKYEVVELIVKFSPKELFVLPNNQLAAIASGCIYIYDENFSLIKEINEIDGIFFCTFGLAVNEQNEIYILDSKFHYRKIILTDALFTKIIKEFDLNDLNNSCSNWRASICYKNNNLYLSDFYNKTIHILNRELELIKSIPLDYEPDKIQVSNETICILSAGYIYFYSLEDFKLKNKYENNF